MVGFWPRITTGRRSVAIESQSRCGVAIRRAQATARLVQMPIDGVFGQAQFAGDFLGAEMTIDKPKAFPLTICESIEAAGRLGQMARPFVHVLILS